LAFANVEWKVECEGTEKCRDWKSIRRCNMQEGGMVERVKGVVHRREEGWT
jgi:hypothetical protein